MTTTETISGMRRIFDEALSIAERKNNDYGDAWRENGWRGNIARIFEKSRRMRNLLWNGNPGAGQLDRETTRETALDMMNTLAFFVMNQDSGVEWGHETPFGWERTPIQTGMGLDTPPSQNVSPHTPDGGNPPDSTRYDIPAGELNLEGKVPVPGAEDDQFDAFPPEEKGVTRKPRPTKRAVADNPQA